MPQSKNSLILLKILAVKNNFWNIGGHTLKKRTNYYGVRVKNKKQIGGNKMITVGQKARVKSSLEVGKRYDGCSFVPEMEQYKGREFLIRAIPFTNRYKLDGAGTWSYTEEMLTTIESEADTMALKVGDRVKVTEVLGMDSDVGIELGNIYTVSKVDWSGDVYIKAPEDDARFMTKTQIEKVEETVKMESTVKVGDTIKVIKVDELDKRRGITLGEKFEVTAVDGDGFIRVNLSREREYPLFSTQFEVVSSEMNFAEMIAKLLTGEYPEGTEITVKDTRGDTETFNVAKNMFGYGLERVGKPFINTHWHVAPSQFNGVWSVVAEEPVKEMSIEDLQKELGYKVKIVE